MQDIMKKLEEYGIPERTVKVESRAATREEILLVHDVEYFESGVVSRLSRHCSSLFTIFLDYNYNFINHFVN